MWEGVGDRTELQHIDPHSYGYKSVSFPFSWAAQPGAWGPSLSGCWFSLPHLFSNWLTSCLHPGYIIILTPTFFLLASQFCTQSTRPRSRLYPDIPWPVTPVICTGAFPILTVWAGSICYTLTLLEDWKKLWNMKVMVIPIVIDVLSTVTKELI